MISNRKRVLIFTDWYLPGYKAGGPIQSVANIVGHLGADYEFRIITGDRDLHADKPYQGITPDMWIRQPDGSMVYYLSPSQLTAATIRKLLLEQQADVIYLNSVFSRFFTIVPLMLRNKLLPGRKVVLAPRGMLGKGALNIKPAKKKLFLMGSKLTGLFRNITWHASSDIEADEVRQVFGKRARVKTALNLTAPRELVLKPRKKNPMHLRAVFLSRISPKKNIEGALQLMKNIPDTMSIEFDIYGPVEDQEYWNKCEELMHHLPPHVRASYRGPLSHEQVGDTLSGYHLSILLTFNENFGHSIVESLAAGCPVLLSEHTPWKDLASKKAGWDIPLDDTAMQLNALKQACSMDQATFDQWSLAAHEMAQQIIHNPGAVEQNRELFA